MKGRTLRRHFRESFRSLGRNGWMTFASISAVTVTLILVGAFALLMANLDKVADDIENDVEIKVLIDELADSQAEDDLQKKIKDLPDVDEVVYSSKEEELKKLIKDLGKDFELWEQQNPLRNVLYVKASNPQQTVEVAKKIDKMEYTAEVNYGKGKIEKLFSVLNSGRNIGLVLIIGLLFTAIFLISNTIRITILARRDEIEIMKLVGATNAFVRIPLLLEGAWLGILGSIIPIAAVSSFYPYFYKQVSPRLQGELFQLVDTMPLIYQVDLLVLAIGVIIGMLGSFMSVRKFLKI
ncbi:cell division protein FtsX [Lysinibacillus alkalisoli]|uniref:Cell division protein FtsX n=1 Tax=Lysinibacillus alkalisoli TaxID=1911548 RepID=A0A917D5E0_9BACI|nr:permease-like cell division protein FtsX [Lysinibacillus alkalisoli]GGG13446.1 cell division protein FtsX [Lysinibacillus alkalisoli]